MHAIQVKAAESEKLETVREGLTLNEAKRQAARLNRVAWRRGERVVALGRGGLRWAHVGRNGQAVVAIIEKVGDR